jgi:hypothetical protein
MDTRQEATTLAVWLAAHPGAQVINQVRPRRAVGAYDVPALAAMTQPHFSRNAPYRRHDSAPP